MKRLAATTLLATAVALALPATAHAGNTRVVVAGPEGDPIAARLRKELTAMGFEPVRVDDAAGCSKQALAAWVEEMKASAAACSDGTAASVWTASPSGLHITDVASPRDGDEHAPDVVAVRAAEIARASLELPSNEPERAPLPPSQPPTWTTEGPAGADTSVLLGNKKKPTRPAPKTPAFTLSTGAAALMGADVTAPALDTEFEVRVTKGLAISTRAALTFDGAMVSSARNRVRVAPSIFGIGPIVPLAASDAFLIPRLGGGVGIVWLRSSPVVTDLVDLFNQTATTSAPDSVTSPMAYVNGTFSMRVGGPVRLAFEGLLGTSAHRLVVRAEGEHMAYWGQPFGSIAMRAEVMFR